MKTRILAGSILGLTLALSLALTSGSLQGQDRLPLFFISKASVQLIK